MKTKTINRINGGIAIWYGIGSLIAAIGGLVVLIVFLYDYFTTNEPFVWWLFAFILALITIPGIIAYVLLRVGYEQVEE